MLPLLARYPWLAALPRASLARHGTPVERSDAAPGLWLKRDDLSADTLGGNKVRALEFLLGGLRPDERVLTVGGRGSTHALATARHARRLGADAVVVRWRQEMNDAARAVDQTLRGEAHTVHDAIGVVDAYARVLLLRAGARIARHPLRWIPAGGTTPLGILGHLNAALELAEQVRAGLLPTPARIVLPLGSGGTAAGLALGLAVAGLPTTVVGARVVPRLVANRARVLALAHRTARLIERLAPAGTPALPRPSRDSVRVEGAFYGGAYGRETDAGREAARRVGALHPELRLDATYSAKACAAALASCDDAPTVLWVTFDARWMTQP
jgi:D-cysteine desulfhydrase